MTTVGQTIVFCGLPCIRYPLIIAIEEEAGGGPPKTMVCPTVKSGGTAKKLLPLAPTPIEGKNILDSSDGAAV